MEKTKEIRIEEYNYPLPEEQIAKFPLAVRDQSKLLVYQDGTIGQTLFNTLPEYIPTGALMIFNNTKVIQARLHFYKATGALIEVLCLEPFSPHDYALMFQQKGQCSWLCIVGNLRKWKEGKLSRQIEVRGETIELSVTRKKEYHGNHLVEFVWNDGYTFAEILESAGELPIPPYLNRATEESDKTNYQTVYSKIEGSVAAPTAGLHFTDNVLSQLDAKGVDREELTLHVGAGTFKPVKSDTIEEHEMHAEYISISRQTLEKLIQHQATCIAVGTTSVRTIESLYYIGVTLAKNPNASEEELRVSQWIPYEYAANTRLIGAVDNGKPEELNNIEALKLVLAYLDRNQLNTLHTSTQIIIAPGYRYRIVRAIVTNFHQPQSTLLLLISAFVGKEWKRIYEYALANKFRFLSYGDSSLLIP